MSDTPQIELTEEALEAAAQKAIAAFEAASDLDGSTRHAAIISVTAAIFRRPASPLVNCPRTSARMRAVQ